MREDPFEDYINELERAFFFGSRPGPPTPPTRRPDLKPCPCCGLAPSYKEGRHLEQGFSPTTHYIQCECGMRTKDILEGYEGSKQSCLNKAAVIWNNRETK